MAIHGAGPYFVFDVSIFFKHLGDHTSGPDRESMTERAFGQSRDIPIAEYSYRHEAEFAAGFLSDAGILFRLQVDDAGGADAGVTIARPAVLWVRPEDVEHARELLELGDDQSVSMPSVRPGRSMTPRGDPFISRLSNVERGVALGLSVLFFGVAAWAGEATIPLAYASMVVAAFLGGSGLLGATIGPVKGILRALSGVVP
jgi:hypothetical protein